jgi:hypothetical protein
MGKTLFDSEGEPIGYISDDPNRTICFWHGHPVASFHGYHVYGFNGRHLSWLTNDIVYDSDGNRIGFTVITCPVAAHKEEGCVS